MTTERQANGPSERRRLTLSDYVKRRNGVTMGAPGGLQNMLYRSLGARSFDAFWHYWNPIFGYLLGRYVYAPSKRLLPAAAALIVTFVVCGAIHDAVTVLVKGSTAFLFTRWFFFLGWGVVLSRFLKMNISRYPWLLRAGCNIAYVLICLAMALALRGWLARI